jgi:SAM-dependent methyltransferase
MHICADSIEVAGTERALSFGHTNPILQNAIIATMEHTRSILQAWLGRTMNRFHKWYCRSGHWKRKLEDEILPWTLRDIDLGDSVLEIGPGPGVTTDWLRTRSKYIECLEIDPALVSSLAHRFRGTSVHVQHGDATAMPYRDGSFSVVVSFTMLHHVPSLSLQNQLFVEAHRVLKPAGIFAGVDSLPSTLMRIIHLRDTMVPVNPATVDGRLKTAGFKSIRVELGTGRFRFSAIRP